MRKRHQEFIGWGSALMVLLTVLVYLPALRGGFVFDDNALIAKNRIIQARDGLYRFWFTTEPLDYWPLTSTVWWAEWRLWGDHAAGYHAANVLLHAINAILLWMILRKLNIPGAWMAGLLFAIHPVNVATVAWISEQKNTLSMFFYAIAILLYLRFDEAGRRRWYGFSLAAFLLALLSKTIAVSLPMVLLLCLWWRHGGVQRRDWLRSLPFFVLSTILGLVTIWFQYHRAMGGHATGTGGFLSRLATAGCLPWFYLSKALWPFPLTVIYPRWEIPAWGWISGLPGVALAGCFGLFYWKRKTWGRPWLFGLGYFVVTLLPVLGFFDQGFQLYSLVADHWQYFSIIGVIAPVVATVVIMCRRRGQPRSYIEMAFGVTVLLVLGAATWTRAGVYQSDETLWRDNLKKNPQAWLACYNLGNARFRAADVPQAILYYEQALRLRPDYPDAHVNLGDCFLQAGKTQAAIDHYEQALRMEPLRADTHNNLGFALLQTGSAEEAIRHYERALQIEPDFAPAHYNLGNILLDEGRIDEAITQYEQAVRINPRYADAHNNLALALLREGKVPAAIDHCEQALQTRPGFAEAHYNLGNALLQAGRAPEAAVQYEEAVHLKPGFIEAQESLARLRVGH